jgi:uncharacterized protein Yka (UPF0111/DUF47 family)
MKTKTNETMKGLSTKELLKLRKSKIENKKRHIQNLVQKRERLNLEIKGAIKSLKRELKTMKKPFRESLELPEDATTQDLRRSLSAVVESDSEVHQLCTEIAHLEHSVITLAEPSSTLEGLDIQFFNDTF